MLCCCAHTKIPLGTPYSECIKPCCEERLEPAMLRVARSTAEELSARPGNGVRLDPRLGMVVPFHRDIDPLAATIDQIERHGAQRGIQEVLLCHNGEPLDLRAAASAPFVILSARNLPFGLTDTVSSSRRPGRLSTPRLAPRRIRKAG